MTSLTDIVDGAIDKWNAGGLDFLYSTTGPEFLVLFVGWFVVVRFLVTFLRSQLGYAHSITALGLLLFEGLGLARYVVASAQGMHRWEFMFALMIIGALLIIITEADVRSASFADGGSYDHWHGGGCGGGGGGGGGCGGCGGD